MIGVGLTSIGEGEDYYAQNFKELKEYENAIDNGILPNFKGLFLTKEDRLRKAVIMSLMANFSLDISKIEAEFETNFFTHFAKELESLKSLEEFVEISEKKIKVTPTGTLLIRNIAMCFDEYMQKFIGQTQSFQRRFDECDARSLGHKPKFAFGVFLRVGATLGGADRCGV